VDDPAEAEYEHLPEPVVGRRVADAVWLAGSVVGGMVLIALLASAVVHVRAGTMSYHEFLSAELSPGELVRIVGARVSYERDVDEYWSAPRGVWETRRGDCEDYAMVVSAYLHRRDIEHMVVGFSLKESLAGHAAVIAELDGTRVLIDPTLATAPGGIRYYRSAHGGTAPTPAEIIEEYAVLPAAIYETPPEPGRPTPTGLLGR
jgi:hypothetical protein